MPVHKNDLPVQPIEKGGTGATSKDAAKQALDIKPGGHKHNLSDIEGFNTNEIPINKGGTGATNAAAARQNLGVYSKEEVYTKQDADEKYDYQLGQVIFASSSPGIGWENVRNGRDVVNKTEDPALFKALNGQENYYLKSLGHWSAEKQFNFPSGTTVNNFVTVVDKNEYYAKIYCINGKWLLFDNGNKKLYHSTDLKSWTTVSNMPFSVGRRVGANTSANNISASPALIYYNGAYIFPSRQYYSTDLDSWLQTECSSEVLKHYTFLSNKILIDENHDYGYYNYPYQYTRFHVGNSRGLTNLKEAYLTAVGDYYVAVLIQDPTTDSNTEGEKTYSIRYIKQDDFASTIKATSNPYIDYNSKWKILEEFTWDSNYYTYTTLEAFETTTENQLYFSIYDKYRYSPYQEYCNIKKTANLGAENPENTIEEVETKPQTRAYPDPEGSYYPYPMPNSTDGKNISTSPGADSWSERINNTTYSIPLKKENSHILMYYYDGKDVYALLSDPLGIYKKDSDTIFIPPFEGGNILFDPYMKTQ